MLPASHGCASKLMTAIILGCVALLTACSGGSAAVATLQSIAVSPQGGTVAAGLTQQFAAIGTFSDGSSRPTGVTWSSSDTTVATIDSNGLAKTLKQGTINITAVSEAITGKAPFTVGPAVVVGLIISPPGG